MSHIADIFIENLGRTMIGGGRIVRDPYDDNIYVERYDIRLKTLLFTREEIDDNIYKSELYPRLCAIREAIGHGPFENGLAGDEGFDWNALAALRKGAKY